VSKKRSLLKKIKHFFEYILIYSIYGLVKSLSIDNASRLGSFIAKVIAPLAPSSKIAYHNIKTFFPELSDKEIKEMISAMWDNICRSAAEMPHIHRMSDKEFYRRVELIDNEAMLKRKKDKANICISSHMGNWEVSGRSILLYNEDVSIIYRKMNKDLMNKTYLNMRQGKFNHIPKGSEGIKQIIGAIKNKHLICFLTDQYFDKGILAKFFGVPAPTAKAPMALALKHNLPVFFCYCIRKKGAYFTVYNYGPFEVSDLIPNLDKIDNPELALTEKMNEIIESWIRKHPEQWCWINRRWR
jgi:Kdo2-lipid IVA lauroyltransferase/acyltransferase